MLTRVLAIRHDVFLSVVDETTLTADAAGDAERLDQGHRWLGALLACSVVLQFVGTFVRYATVTPSPAVGPDLPASPAFSYSLYDGMHWGLPTFLLTIAIAGTLAYLITRHRDRAYVALVAGFCASSLGSAAWLMYAWTRFGSSHVGPGFYLLLASRVIAAVVAVGAVLLLRPLARPAFAFKPLRLVLAVGSTLAVGASAILVQLRLPFEPLSLFSPLAVTSGTAAVIAFTSIAAFPLIALRFGNRVGSWLLLGLAASEAISALEAVFRRYGNFRGTSFHAHLSAGWWIEILAVALLVILAYEIRSPEPDRQCEMLSSQAP